jgi:hypothetical protein
MSTDALPNLLQAKAHSDAKRYDLKHRVLAQMMKRNPGAFVIDSDNGKGIVGITHVETGFRLHVPKQVLPVSLEKLASNKSKSILSLVRRFKDLTPRFREKFVGQQAGKLLENTVDYVKNTPRVNSAVRQLADYRIMDPANRGFHMRLGSYAGAPLGAITGAATGDTTEERIRNSLIGAGVGAGAGVGVGRYLPRAMQVGMGRVLTNLVDPHIYDSKMHLGSVIGGVRRAGFKGTARALINDQPIHPIAPARHALFRDFFGLKRFKGTENVFKDVGTDANGMRTLRHNVRDAGARADLRDIHSARLQTLTGAGSDDKYMKRGLPTLTSGGSPGKFVVNPDGNWEDVWDFGLHKGQQIDSTENLLRGLVSPFGTPSKVVGKTLNESQVLRFSPMTPHRFKSIHPSFTEPVINRAVNGAGLDQKELQAYLKQKLISGDKNPIMQSIAGRAAGKPYNLLGDLAKSEGVSNSDMRVLLGGKPRSIHTTTNRDPKWEPGDLKAMFASRITGASPKEVGSAIDTMPPTQQEALRVGLTGWAAKGRPAGGEKDILAKVLGFTSDELPILLG